MVLQAILQADMDGEKSPKKTDEESDRVTPVRSLERPYTDLDLPTSVGVWIGEDDAKLLRDFDGIGEQRYGSRYKRSKELQKAMAAHVAIERAMDAVGYHFDSYQDRAAFIRQLIFDYAREHGDY